MQKNYLYLIFFRNELINYTFDIFYFKRLLRKYEEKGIKVYGRRVRIQDLLEISTVAR